jgi:cell division transport system permease protein
MWASVSRNKTLTIATIITTFVSLLLFGLSLLIQRGFDNQLSQWEGGVELIVYVQNDATDEQIQVIREALESQPSVIDSARLEYLDIDAAMAEVQRLFAGDPDTLQLLDENNVPTQFKVVPADESSIVLLGQLSESFQDLPGVETVAFPGEQIEVLRELRGFLGFWLYMITIFLLLSTILLIWNTIRTAMFARRREIEVMKLVGATNWFIRLPFMLEGMLQGLIGGALASGVMLFSNAKWTTDVRAFPTDSGLAGFVVTDGYPIWIVGVLLGLGAVVGATVSGTAASRFLDV